MFKMYNENSGKWYEGQIIAFEAKAEPQNQGPKANLMDRITNPKKDVLYNLGPGFTTARISEQNVFDYLTAE